MSLVNKYIDSGSFLTATAVYDDINLTTKATDGYYQFGGQYRRQVSGALLTATVCADCFAFDSLDYVSTSASDLCCETQTSVQYYYPAGSTFLTTTNIYTDVNLSNIAADGFYQEPAANQYRQITGSVLGTVTTCPSCAEPCGTSITIPSGAQGYYNLDFDAGSTASDVGAIVVYFNPASIPDGIRVLYDNVFYNTLTNNTDGRIQTTSGVTGAFTIVGNASDTCVPSAPNTNSYTFFDGIIGGAWNNTGTTQSITINTGDFVGGGVSQYSTLVIPKTTATPNIVSIQVLGPCSSTAWNVQVSCPANLPSVLASTAQSTDACQSTQNTSVYFAKNYNDTNTVPIVGNFVFTDQNGATPLNNTSTVQYYITGTIAFSVLNGVVVSSATCTSGSSQLRISDCQTGNTWTMTNTYGHVLTNVLQYQQGVPGQGAVYCGTVTQVNVSGTNDATVNGAQSYSCGDATHCLQ